MATPNLTELMAVTCVVESSLLLAAEWPRIMVEYISPLLQRLAENHTPGYQMMFRLGFVTYGIGTTQPTPVLVKRFFVPFQVITKELREHPDQMGIGQTSSGGSAGMAALEGLVAAIELFDVLRTSIETRPILPPNQAKDITYRPPRLVSHILHIAASPADDTELPLWNDSPQLDDVGWETLPAELKKRDINLSVISLRPVPRFAELHSSAANKGVTPPWFKVRAPHTLLLTGFPPELKTAKRPAEPQAAPDNKRTKVQTPTESSPKVSSSPVPPLLTQQTPVIAHQAPVVNTSDSPLQRPPIFNNPALLAKLREFDLSIKKLDVDFTTALNQGRASDAEQIKELRDNKIVTLNKLKQAIQLAARQPTGARNVAQGQQPPQATASSSIQPPSLMPQSITGPVYQDTSRGPDSQALKQLMQNRSGSAVPTLPNQPIIPSASHQGNLGFPANLTPEMAGQMQKLIDNRGIRPPQLPSLPQGQQVNAQGGMTAPAMSQPLPNGRSFWEGSLTWTGFDVATLDQKVLHAIVKITSPKDDILPETWPKTLTLTPSQINAVPMQDLQLWVRRTRALMVTLAPHPRSPDLQNNERNVRSLCELLIQKNIYALAAWTLPSGMQTHNLLIFPMNDKRLFGTVFPEGGIPEMPRPIASILAQLPPNVAAQLQRLTPEQRTVWVHQMMMRGSTKQAQQQPLNTQQLQGQFQSPNSLDPSSQSLAQNVGTNFQGGYPSNGFQLPNGGNTPGGNGMTPQLMAFMGSQQAAMSSMHRRTPSGSPMPQQVGAGGVSHEMLQSFMRRNADGSAGAST